MIDGQTYQGSIENDIVFDHFELAGFEALGTVSVVAYYDNFEVSSQEQDLYFDGEVKVVENFTDMEMRLSWDLTATPNNHQKPIRTKTENGIVLNLSTGSYLSGSWIVEGSDDTSVNAYFDTDGNGLEYSVNGSSQQLIPWQDL
jgi:hypothetical protein